MPADSRHTRAAIDALAAREYERSGDSYTRSAWETLAEPREGLSPFETDEKGWVGRGLEALTVATVAYRIAGYPERATHRAVEGVAIARDLADSAEHSVQAACFAEFVADFHLVGGLDGATEAYQEAERAYEALEIDDPQYWATTPLFEAAAGAIKQVARTTANGEIAVTWEDLHGSDPSESGAFLAARARFKRQRFASLLEQALSESHLAAPRGTTAYATDQYRCPNCDSTDVNWTGERTLCLRCSTPMKE